MTTPLFLNFDQKFHDEKVEVVRTDATRNNPIIQF